MAFYFPTMRKTSENFETTLIKLAVQHGAACWPWPGRRNAKGYGQRSPNNTPRKLSTLAHRAAYELVVGRVPDGWNLEHRCDQPSCCNPFHLAVVLPAANTLRGCAAPAVNARKTHCINGHPFNAENTLPRAHGHRRCRICKREAEQRRYQRRQRAPTARQTASTPPSAKS